MKSKKISHRQQWKKPVSVFASLIILLLTNSAFAEAPKTYSTVPQQAGICFSNEDAGKMVVELENYNKQEDVIALLKEENAELEKKIVNMQKISEFQDAQLATANETIKKLNELQETTKKAYEKQIEESKPSFWSNLKTAGGGAVIGAVLMAVIALL